MIGSSWSGKMATTRQPRPCPRPARPPRPRLCPARTCLCTRDMLPLGGVECNCVAVSGESKPRSTASRTGTGSRGVEQTWLAASGKSEPHSTATKTGITARRRVRKCGLTAAAVAAGVVMEDRRCCRCCRRGAGAARLAMLAPLPGRKTSLARLCSRIHETKRKRRARE